MTEGSPATRTGLMRNPWFWGVIIGIVTVTLIRPFTRYEPEPPPVLGALPPFSLVDQNGQPFGTEQLRGKVWIANFFFASCRSVCPPLMRAAADVQDKLERSGVPVLLVSITVDPENDPPERLREVAREYGVKDGRWVLLTGPLDTVRTLVVDGFATAMDDPEPSRDLYDIAHSTKFVLVDGEANIRGYYGSDEMGIDEVYHRAQHVLGEAAEKE